MHGNYVRNSYDDDGAAPRPAGRVQASPLARRTSARDRDLELLLLEADSLAELRGRLAYLADSTRGLPASEMAALAAALHRQLIGRPVRSAILASSGDQASGRMTRLLAVTGRGARIAVDVPGGVFLGQADGPLAAQIAAQTPVVPLATDSTSLPGVLSVAAAAYVFGAPVQSLVLLATRTG